jgi:cyanuric acid amidohydrolase
MQSTPASEPASYLMLCLSQLIGDRMGLPAQSVSKSVPFVFSGGVEGVLSPHYAVFTVDPESATGGEEKLLAVGVAFTPKLSPSDIGRQQQIDLTAEAVEQAMATAGIESPDDVHSFRSRVQPSPSTTSSRRATPV